MTTRPASYFRKIAIIWLRLMGVLLILYGIIGAVFLTRWENPDGSSPSGAAWLSPALYILGGLLLSALSEPWGGWSLGVSMIQDLVPPPPNMRLKLTARVDCGMSLSSARCSLSAIR